MANNSEKRRIWGMVNKIAKACNKDPEDVYLWAVQQIVPLKEFSLPEGSADAFIKRWTSRGIGHIADVTGKSNGETHMIIGAGISAFYPHQIEELIQLLMDVAWDYRIPLD